MARTTMKTMPRRSLVLGMSALGAVLFLTLAVYSADRSVSSRKDENVELESSDMKTIDKMLSHIHSLTEKYQPKSGAKTHHHHHDHHQSSDDTKSAAKTIDAKTIDAKTIDSTPTFTTTKHHSSHSAHHLAAALKHLHHKAAAASKSKKSHHGDDEDASGKHESKALQEAESAEANLSKNGGKQKQDSSKEIKKRSLIAAKMKALQAKINSDFDKVLSKGKKAGYLPPITLPHM